MAWNGSNGLYAGQPGYLPYTAWRNTPAEAAMRDFMVTHANLPLGARLWDFGTPGYLDDDGWRLEQGKVHARGGYVDLEFDAATAALLSPPDQVIRPATIESLILGLSDPSALAAVQVFARIEPGVGVGLRLGSRSPPRDSHTAAAGVQIPLAWPPAWRSNRTIVAEMKIVMAFDAEIAAARLDRIALYPRATRR